MKIAFRLDASAQIGTGHFIRCLTLADALSQRGAQIRFLSRHLPDHLRGMLEDRKYEFKALISTPEAPDSDDLFHAHWLGTSQRADAQDAIWSLSDSTWDWLVVDHYALDHRWEAMLRHAAKNILVIDDIADRLHDCDVLLDQNLYENMHVRYPGKTPERCRLLLGPRYALLREEFRQMRARVNPRAGFVKRILIFFGGVDAANYTGRAMEALADMTISNLHVDVVIGSQHPCRDRIETDCAKYGFACHVQTDRMAELMADADLAIGAGGTVTWERCCLGLPAFAFSTAENQQRQIADAACEGLLYAPETADEFIPMMKRHLRALMENGRLRSAISRNGMRAVDGRGVARIVGELGCTGIEMRPARQDDAEKLFEWRNHPTIRAVSRTTDPISREVHQRWFSSVLTAPDKVLLIGERGGRPVGVVRFDMLGDEAEVSIYLVPGLEQPGQGAELLCSAEHWLGVHRPGTCKIRAHVLGANERSRRLFMGAGYQPESGSYLKKFYSK